MELSRQKKKNDKSLNYKKKNRRKFFRSVLQLIFLLFVFSYLLKLIFTLEYYAEPASASWDNKEGFIALSYFGVGRTESATLIAKDQLKDHIKVLKDHGYVTISQQDILDFYQKSKPLPDKALFLSFEDGRNDSGIYAQPLLEEFNYKATILTYANKFNQKEFKFLQAKDLKKMTESGYWEVGSNGYRLSYINIHHKDGSFIPLKKEEEFIPYKAKEYNHYLMDFIRDKYGVPVENRQEMEKRITKDYQLMGEIYQTELGYIPEMYMIMHANALYNNATNNLVENINDDKIKQNFQLHINREGDMLNDQEKDLFDLSRVQPAPHWSTNHLLMKMKLDTKQKVDFVLGDEAQAKLWSLHKGAVEYKENETIVTSVPEGEGLITLKEKLEFGDHFKLDVYLNGIDEGQQSIYLKQGTDLDAYTRIYVEANHLYVMQKASNSNEEKLISKKEINSPRKKKMNLEIKGNELSILINDKSIMKNITLDLEKNFNSISLSARPSEDVQENIENDDLYHKGKEIYDARFIDLQITSYADNAEDGRIIFSNQHQGLDRAIYLLKGWGDQLIDAAIDIF